VSEVRKRPTIEERVDEALFEIAFQMGRVYSIDPSDTEKNRQFEAALRRILEKLVRRYT
jgi:hypothetical protein